MGINSSRTIKKKALWVITDLSEGSGGQRTVFQNVMYLVSKGYHCDLLVDITKVSPDNIREKLLKWYDIDFPGEIFCNEIPKIKYDAVFATYYTTAQVVMKTNAKQKFYFVQDYEPWFFPMSEERIQAKASYSLGLKPITIGRWLAGRLFNKFGTKANHFSFCADSSIYRIDESIKKEDAICFIYQPHKLWRCAEMGLKALQIIQSVRPDLKIYLYGSPKKIPFNIDVEHLGILSTNECNELYNRCKVGICMSASNPSRIPFEMMAAGLPVVDLYLENNLYDFPEEGCLLAEPSAEAIAAAVLKILDDEKLRQKMSSDGNKYMMDYPLERGFMEFGKAIDDVLNNKYIRQNSYKKKYNKKAIKAPRELEWSFPAVVFKTQEEIDAEKQREEILKRQKQEEEWRKNLTIPQKIYLKIRYILLGR